MVCVCLAWLSTDVNIFATKMTSTRSPLQLLFLVRVIDFTCLGVASSSASCCTCAATIVACATAPRPLGSLLTNACTPREDYTGHSPNRIHSTRFKREQNTKKGHLGNTL